MEFPAWISKQNLQLIACRIAFQAVRLLVAAALLFYNLPVNAQRQMEYLGRGVVVVRPSADSVFIGWRLSGSDPEDIAFNVYRQTGSQPAVKLNSAPIGSVTFFIDTKADLTRANAYYVTPVINGKEGKPSASFTLQANPAQRQYLSVPLQVPPPDEVFGEKYTYSANDASAGDLDGDGEYEIVLKWDPSLTRNPPQTGLTGLQIIDAYKLDGRLLWRINLGKNIRSGAAYTQFLVYDLDGDGKAEMICKTADGTMDGAGNFIGDKDKDWRTLSPKGDPTFGKIVNGPEYLTVFDGLTGKALVTETYLSSRYPLDGWGGIGGNGGNDKTGGRPDRFTAGIAYLDGIHPSAVFVRGWYGRTVAAAWDYRDGKLRSRWVFDSKDAKNPYSGQGNHSISVADVDDDGRDEFCVGSMTLDDDGTGLYTTGLRHGDALHISDMDPDRPGLEVFGVHENEEATVALQTPGVAMFDAKTGKILFSLGPGVDVGRGVAADIDPTHPGFENWGGPGGLRDVHGATITSKTPSSTNFVLWWDGDLTRELLDKNRIDKWDWKDNVTLNLLTAKGCTSNNGTKSTPCLSADILGDWREEVIWRTDDNSELRIYTTVIPSKYRFYTLMHDPQYRLSIAWQNVAYNQPPHPGFFLGDGMKIPPRPNIICTRSLPDTSFAMHKLIFADDFRDPPDSEKWVAEIAPLPDSRVYTRNGKLILDTGGGVTVWLNKRLSGNLIIEFDRKVVVAKGKNDRLSDMNFFWMASDPRNQDIFTRNGVLEKYDSLLLYYVGMGGNTNSTTRFRKYDGNGNRTLLHEYKDAGHLLKPNQTYHIKIVVKEGATSFWADGICYFSYQDPQPVREGYFGFRSTWSHQEIDRFRCYTDR
jgi:rhamnogalacturonan endolyase